MELKVIFERKTTQNCHKSIPVLSEECGYRVGQDLALIVDVLQDVLGPLHQVPDLIAGRGTIHTPCHLLLHLISQHILSQSL